MSKKKKIKNEKRSRSPSELVVRDQLLKRLNLYITLHYSDPVIGRTGKVMTAYVTACLSAAASLRALLLQMEDAT